MVCYNLCINAKTESFHRRKRAERPGGRCKPGAQETEFSLPSRIAEPDDGVGGYGMPRYQSKGYEVSDERPSQDGNQGGTAIIDRP